MMFRSWVIYSLFFLTSAFSCPVDEISVLEPQTQKASCLKRWISDTLVVVVEKECVPCAELLNRIRSEKTGNNKEWGVTLVWIETDLHSCLTSALKMSGFAKSWCSPRDEIAKKWGLDSTPVVFWEKAKQKSVQRGNVSKTKALPWNAG